MTEREKIISLARECSKPDMVDCYHNGYFTIDAEELETFYHAAITNFLKSSGQYLTNDASREACIKQAKSEAFEAAAKLCDEQYPYSVHHTDQLAAKNCAAAIREMAREMK